MLTLNNFAVETEPTTSCAGKYLLCNKATAVSFVKALSNLFSLTDSVLVTLKPEPTQANKTYKTIAAVMLDC